MRRLALLIAVALLALTPAAALGKTTPNITFKSSGKAAAPGAVAGTGADGTFEDFPFKIAPDDTNGTISIAVQWSNPADDFDLYVYRKNSKGELDQVGSSAGGPPSTQEQTVIQAQSTPVPPGDYVVRIQNYASSSSDFSGFVKFTEFATPNVKPTASLKAPKKHSAASDVKLDASKSSDPDGHIANYAWDLDGDGSIETDGGSSPTLSHRFAPGVHHVTVRVTDDKGARAYATRTIRVTPARVARRGKR